MYLEFFKLKQFPFAAASDEKFYFSSRVHNEALANMLYTVQQRKGMTLVTGEVGAGKTFLARVLCSRLDNSSVKLMIGRPADTPKQLLRLIAGGLGVPIGRDPDSLNMVTGIEQTLQDHQRRGRCVVVILDELQDLSDHAMEEIRLLWNMEQEGQRLIQFVLMGQPELRVRLREDRWASLRQRILLSYHLGAMEAPETYRYILHRRKIAAGEGCPLRFTQRALDEIHLATGGIPRRINALCEHALMVAYAAGTTKITGELVRSAAEAARTGSLTAAPVILRPIGPA